MKKNSLSNFLSFLNLTQVHAKSENEKFLLGLNCWWIEYKGDGDTLVKLRSRFLSTLMGIRYSSNKEMKKIERLGVEENLEFELEKKYEQISKVNKRTVR